MLLEVSAGNAAALAFYAAEGFTEIAPATAATTATGPTPW